MPEIRETYLYVWELEKAYLLGWDLVSSIPGNNIPALGRRYFSDIDGVQTSNKKNIRKIHAELCYAAAERWQHSYTPEELVITEFDELSGGVSAGFLDEIWAAFSSGVTDSIRAELERLTDEDYGL